MKRNYRTRTQIYSEILRLLEEKSPRILTHIIFGANLNNTLCYRYLGVLERAGLIKKNEQPRSWGITEEGQAWLREYSILKRLSQGVPQETKGLC